MKKGLRSLMLIALLGFSTYIYSQCTVRNIIIQNVSVTNSTGSSCSVRFDVSFNIENNNGNKYIFIHSWIESQYPNYFNCVNGTPADHGTIHAPKFNDLQNAFLNIGLDNNDSIPVVLTTYPPDPSVPLNSVASVQKYILPDGSATIILHGVTTTLPIACGTPVNIISDVWSSQAAQAQVAHCVNCGINFAAGYLTAAGLANCSTLTFIATLTNQTALALSGTYSVHADINGDGFFSPLIDTAISATLAFNISAGIGMTTTITGSIPPANANQDLFLLLTQPNGATTVFILHSTVCAPLPVNFVLFTATRVNSSNVMLKWETATEINNSGFAILRNTGNDNWQLIGFVSSQAVAGNSNAILDYNFSDPNSEKGITQYRIRQVDLDGKTKFSDIRAVRGEGQKGQTIIYPNPSSTGSVNVVFDMTNTTRDVLLYDMTGRLLRQWKNLSGNTLRIDNLRTGIYNLKITDNKNEVSTAERFVVQ